MVDRNVSYSALGLVLAGCFALLAGCGGREPAPTASQGPELASISDIVIRVAAQENEDPFVAGKSAAEALRESLSPTEPKVVLVAECFEGEEAKKQLLAGVCSVLPASVVCGGATYGSFGQEGCLDLDAVSLLGVGGEGIGVKSSLGEAIGIAGLTLEEDSETIATQLRAAGARLARAVSTGPDDRLLIVIPDAHSPKNQFLVEGVQEVLGKDFPITGGSVNKNAGQTFVYYGGKMYRDSAFALMLSGDFQVSLSGRQAKENAQVIATARDGAAEVLESVDGRPFAALAFNCAGRMGKLDNIEDELAAMQEVLGKEIPLFGCYCAGEIGPADVETQDPDALSSGVGWHVMITLLSRK